MWSLIPGQRSNPVPPAVEVQSLDHWTSGEAPPVTLGKRGFKRQMFGVRVATHGLSSVWLHW